MPRKSTLLLSVSYHDSSPKVVSWVQLGRQLAPPSRRRSRPAAGPSRAGGPGGRGAHSRTLRTRRIARAPARRAGRSASQGLQAGASNEVPGPGQGDRNRSTAEIGLIWVQLSIGRYTSCSLRCPALLRFQPCRTRPSTRRSDDPVGGDQGELEHRHPLLCRGEVYGAERARMAAWSICEVEHRD